MQVTPKIIKPYEDRFGNYPYLQWIESIKDPIIEARINTRIARLKAGSPGDCKRVGKGVFELRIDIGPGYRVYFATRGNTIVILLCGGDKKTQKKDIKRAQEFAAEIVW